jgi:hypothetical protein
MSFWWFHGRKFLPACEIYRVAKPGARILIGEIPFEPGPPPEPEFATTRETIGYLYNQYGLRTALGMLRRMVFWKLRGHPITIRSGSQVSFYAQPEEVIALARAAGLEYVRHWRHEDPGNRYNYLFRKAEAGSIAKPRGA